MLSLYLLNLLTTLQESPPTPNYLSFIPQIIGFPLKLSSGSISQSLEITRFCTLLCWECPLYIDISFTIRECSFRKIQLSSSCTIKLIAAACRSKLACPTPSQYTFPDVFQLPELRSQLHFDSLHCMKIDPRI